MGMDGKNEADWDGEGGYGQNEGNEEQGTIATNAPVVVSGPTGLAPTLWLILNTRVLSKFSSRIST